MVLQSKGVWVGMNHVGFPNLRQFITQDCCKGSDLGIWSDKHVKSVFVLRGGDQ
jgi:hypothetical protein